MSISREAAPRSERHDDVRLRALLTAAQRRQRGALEAVVERYRPMVQSIATRHRAQRGGEELDDLVQIGLVALIEAVDRYAPDRGAFEHYAYVTVSGAVKRYLRDRSWRFAIPRSVHDAWVAIERVRPRLAAALGRDPDENELVEATGLDCERVREAIKVGVISRPISIDTPVGDEEGEPLGSRLTDDSDPLRGAEQRVLIGQLARALQPRDRAVLALRFARDLTQRDVGRIVGVSQMHVSRIVRSALAKMGKASGTHGGRPSA